MFDDYLDRLGVERAVPSVDHLFRLHRAHVERVPYETTWMFLEETRGVDQRASIDLIARQGRGGYCFHLNGAFAALLEHLGYGVTLHLGGVHHPEPDAADLANHLVLIVENLPTADNPSGVWYVDAGLGDGLYEPMPLVAGAANQPPAEFVLAEVDDGVGHWRLTPDDGAGIDAMSFHRDPTIIEAFAARHEVLSTSPESGFRKMVTVQRRSDDGTIVLRGRVITHRTPTGVEREVLATRDEWFGALATRFQLPLAHLDPDALDRLWDHVLSVGLPDSLITPDEP